MSLQEGYAVDYGVVMTYGARHEVGLPLVTPTLPQIKAAQDALVAGIASGELAEADCPVEHYFAPGLYTRKCSIPAGSVVVGKMHRHQHPTFLMQGMVAINTDKGMELIHGPHIWISQTNAKRILRTVTDCVFATVHLNPDDTTDLEAIEAAVIVPESQIEYHKEVAQMEFAEDLQAVYA